jgi:hypothetical protein
VQFVIDAQGRIRCLYDEAIDLHALGELTIVRGSHVEPTASGQWLVNLAPVHGPTLGPFQLRSQALQAEQAWLEQNWLTGHTQ